VIVCHPVAIAQAIRRTIVARPRLAPITAATGAVRRVRRAAVACRHLGPVALPAALVATAIPTPAADVGRGDGAGGTGPNDGFAVAGIGGGPHGWPASASSLAPGGTPGQERGGPFLDLPGTGPLTRQDDLPRSPDPGPPVIGYNAPEFRVAATEVPEPSAVAVLCLALLALAVTRRRRAVVS